MTNRNTKWMLALLLCAVMALGISAANADASVIFGEPYVERSWNGSAVVSTNKDADVAVIPSDGVMTTGWDGWYLLNSNVTVNGRILLTRDINLILGDGCTLDVKGIYIPAGCTLTTRSRATSRIPPTRC